MAEQYLSQDPNAGLDDQYLSTDPNAGLEPKPEGGIVANALAGAGDVIKGFAQQFVPDLSLKHLATIAYGPINAQIQGYNALKSIVDTGEQIAEAEKTPPFSRERFAAGFNVAGQLGLLAAGGRAPKLAEIAGIEKPIEAMPQTPEPLVSEVAAKQTEIIPESVPKVEEVIPNAEQVQGPTRPDVNVQLPGGESAREVYGGEMPANVGGEGVPEGGQGEALQQTQEVAPFAPYANEILSKVSYVDKPESRLASDAAGLYNRKLKEINLPAESPHNPVATEFVKAHEQAHAIWDGLQNVTASEMMRADPEAFEAFKETSAGKSQIIRHKIKGDNVNEPSSYDWIEAVPDLYAEMKVKGIRNPALENWLEKAIPEGNRPSAPVPQPEQPKIVAAAIQDAETGKIFTGPSHPQIYDKFPQIEGDPGEAFTGEGWNTGGNYVDGFVDQNGKFYDREEAAALHGLTNEASMGELESVAGKIPEAPYKILKPQQSPSQIPKGGTELPQVGQPKSEAGASTGSGPVSQKPEEFPYTVNGYPAFITKGLGDKPWRVTLMDETEPTEVAGHYDLTEKQKLRLESNKPVLVEGQSLLLAPREEILPAQTDPSAGAEPTTAGKASREEIGISGAGKSTQGDTGTQPVEPPAAPPPAEAEVPKTGVSSERFVEQYGEDAPVPNTGKSAGELKRIGQTRLDNFQKTGDVKDDPYAVLTNLREGKVPVSQLADDVSLIRAEHQRLRADAINAEGTPEYEAKSQAALDMAQAIKEVAHGPASDMMRAFQEYDKPRYDNVTDFDQALRERLGRESTSQERVKFKELADDVKSTRNGAEEAINGAQKRLSKMPKLNFEDAMKSVHDQIAQLTKDCIL